MRIRQSLPIALALGLLVLVSLAPYSQRSTAAPVSATLEPFAARPASQGALTASQHMPISFEVNQGQAQSQVRFLARGSGYNLFLTPKQALLALDDSEQAPAAAPDRFSPAANPAPLASARPPALVGMQFLNANPQPEITGEQPLPGIVNYLLGNDPAQWHTNIPTYAQVRYHNIYPGIDLVYYSNQGHLEYAFIVAPGSNPSQIHLGFTGAHSLNLDSQGTLLLHLPGSDLPESAPLVYQEINGTRQAISGSYVLQGSAKVGFALGAYDASQPLVIDPMVFFSTYLGGSTNDDGMGVAVDSAGNSYITGSTSSNNFSPQNPLQSAFGGGPSDAFVTKVNAAGTALVYSTYLGGSGADWGAGIAVDSTGDAYVSGGTSSTDFPTSSPLQATNAGATNAFVAKLNATGSMLVYSTYLGGSNYDYASAITIDSTGNAYITGSASSTHFPTTANAWQTTFGGGIADAFVSELNAAGSMLVYSTYLGGTGADWGTGIAVDSGKNAYVTGGTASTNFPTHTPLQSANAGIADAFVTELNAGGSMLVYSTYLGGSNYDYASAIAVDSAGNAYVTGSTHSTNFPTRTPAQSSRAGSFDAFVTKISATTRALVYSTYLGGRDSDAGTGIAIDSGNNVYVVGSTSSTNFPTHMPLQTANAGGTDAFITRVNAGGNIILYSSYLGSSNDDQANAIALDSWGYAYVTGATTSSNFPTLNPIQAYAGAQDAFLVKMNPMTAAQISVSPGSLSLITTPGSSPAQQTLTLSNTGGTVLNWTANFSPSSSWVSVSPSSGTLRASGTQPLALTFNTSSTTPQTYTTNLTLTDPNAANSPLSVPVTVVSANVSKTWYFAEGYTGGSFTEYLTLANPNSAQANVTVTYLLGSGSPRHKTYIVPAQQRSTIDVNGQVGKGENVSMVITSDQPIVAERPMYFTFTGLPGYSIPGGSDVLGATSLSTNFDFGYLDTSKGHATYLTILNQNSSAMTVTINYFSAAGVPSTRMHSIPANSRGTVYVNGEGLTAGSYSALVTLSEPGLVERPLYLKDSSTGFTGSADVVGVPQPQTRWDFAEGYTSSTFSERYILSNPGGTTANATITFFMSNGSTAMQSVILAPGQQLVVSANALLGSNNVNNSAEVTSDQPILAERFISFKYVGPAGGHTGNVSVPGASDVLGASAPGNLFYFAEGYSGAVFAEYLTIENPNATSATVQVTFLPQGKPSFARVYTIGPKTRFTLYTNGVLSNQSFSMVVESNVAIVAERPMYFIFNGKQTGGSDVVGYQP